MKTEFKQKTVLIGALYARVSVDDAAQVEHGSLEQQRNLGLDHAIYLTRSTGIEHSVKYVLIEERGISGGTTKRPKYQELLKLVENRKIDFVIAKEISRISRSTKDFCEFMEMCRSCGVAVYIKGLDINPNQPNGEMVFKMLATIAEFERKIIVQRTKDSIRSSALHNSKINGGSIPLGLKRTPKKGFLEADPDEIKSVQLIFKIFSETGSLRATLDEARRLGIKNKNGKQFNFSALRRLLTNLKYIGKMKVIHGDNDEKTTTVDLPFGELVPKDLFDEVQIKMAQLLSHKNHRNRKRTRTYILSGILEFEDGTKFQGSSGTRRDKTRAHYYFHPGQKLRINAVDIEGAIFKALREAYEDNKDLSHYLNQLEKHESSTLDALEFQIREKKKAIQDQRDQEIQLKEKFHALKPEDLKNESILSWLNEEIQAQKVIKEALEKELVELEQDYQYFLGNRLSSDQFKERMKGIFDRLTKADPDRQKEFLREIFTKIEVHRSNQIKLVWKLPSGCDNGGRGFAYRNETGG
jgi:DNA invertase Pin-like site-specific DNA recombinase